MIGGKNNEENENMKTIFELNSQFISYLLWLISNLMHAFQVYYCKEDEVCLYQSVAFEVPFRDAIPGSSPAEVSLDYAVKPKTPTNSLLAVAR